MAKQAAPPPELNIPPSDSTVEVFIINGAWISNIPTKFFMNPPIPGYDSIDAPCYGFLIKRKNATRPSKYDQMIFDLGIRKDFENGPKSVVDRVTQGGYKVDVKKDVAETLREGGEDLNKIGAIIWSHYHFDHTGDPSTFPSSTDLIVGPGFKKAFVPSYPTIPDGPVHEGAWEGRELREISFEEDGRGFKIGPFRAYDFYGDGSFYLLDSPGHATGHMCGLARTSADPPEFIVMGGDIAHHGGEFRPTKWLPLPENIQPNPFEPPFAKSTVVCPGHLFEAIHPNKRGDEPFMAPDAPIHENKELAIESCNNWQECDAQENIFAMVAHDASLMEIVDFYPKSANGWRRQGWKDAGRWRFLRDFDTGLLGGSVPEDVQPSVVLSAQ